MYVTKRAISVWKQKCMGQQSSRHTQIYDNARHLGPRCGCSAGIVANILNQCLLSMEERLNYTCAILSMCARLSAQLLQFVTKPVHSVGLLPCNLIELPVYVL
jgi:hypothetical protein